MLVAQVPAVADRFRLASPSGSGRSRMPTRDGTISLLAFLNDVSNRRSSTCPGLHAAAVKAGSTGVVAATGLALGWSPQATGNLMPTRLRDWNFSTHVLARWDVT